MIPKVQKYAEGARREKIEPKTVSYQTVVEGVGDPLMSAKLAFMLTLCA